MFEHFKGEEVFVKKVLDYLDQVQYKQRLILTQFLDPYHQSIVKSVIGHQDEVQVLENGGFIHSESQRIIIAPYFYEIEKEDFEIVVCKIIYAKNFEKLTHAKRAVVAFSKCLNNIFELAIFHPRKLFN